jgi:selenocysteine-specific elongation factor
VFRAYSPAATVAGGRVLDPEPSRAGVRRPSALDRFQRLDDERLPLALWLEEAAGAGVDVESLVRRGGATHDEVAEALDRLAADEAAFRAADRTFDMTLVRHVRQRLLASVAAHHRAHPLEAGMPRERLRDEAAPGAAPQLFDGVLMMLVGEGTVKGADRIALASHQPTLTSGQAALGAKIEGAAREAGLAALDASGLASRVGAGEDAIGEVVGYLVRERRLVRVDSLLVAAEALDALAADIRARGRAHGPERATVDIADFKARYGLSRKHAIPLLEWLDRERLTRRVGNRREILATGGG